MWSSARKPSLAPPSNQEPDEPDESAAFTGDRLAEKRRDCDRHSPWQRGTNENTNGLLQQYFPKGTNLSVHSAQDLHWVARELNDRPRERLAFDKPTELISDLLLR